MTITVWPANAVTGAPSYSGRMLRQVDGVALAGATASRPLGARSGVRPGTPTTTVTVTAGVWAVGPHAGVLDMQSAAEAGAYWYSTDRSGTTPDSTNSGNITAANATNPRVDIVFVRVDDPSESDGTSVPAVVFGYMAGTAAPSPSAPATPARSMVLATIAVPASGGGSPTVTWVAPYAVAAGGIIPCRNSTELAALSSIGSAEAPVFASMGAALYSHDGTNLVQLAPQETRRAIPTGTLTATRTTFAAVNLSPGWWEVTGWIYFSVAEGSAQQKTVVLRNATAGSDYVAAEDGPQGSVNSKQAVSISDIIQVTVSTSVALQAWAATATGTQLVAGGRLLAKRVGAPS